MSARTRRQKAALAENGEESEEGNGVVATPSKPQSKERSRSAAPEEPRENIFLFAPNLIGMYGSFSFDVILAS